MRRLGPWGGFWPGPPTERIVVDHAPQARVPSAPDSQAPGNVWAGVPMNQILTRTQRADQPAPRHPALSEASASAAISLPLLAPPLPKHSMIELAYLIRTGNIMLDT